MKTCAWGAALVLIAACTPMPARPTARASASSSSGATAGPAPEPPQYVLRQPAKTAAGQRFELGQDRVGLIVRGERWLVNGRGAPVRMLDEGLGLQRAQEIDKGAGGGFVFVGSRALYAASSFDGELREIALGSMSAVSVGPGFALATLEDGRVRALDLHTGQLRAGLPLGVVLVRTADDGSAALITHGGRAFVSRDRGARWADVTKEVGVPIGLELSEGRLYITEVSGDALRLDASGLVRTSTPPRAAPRFDPAWTRSETPLELAVSRGAMLDDDRAVLVDAGTVFEVSLRTGAITSREPGALPPQGSCTATATHEHLVFLCSNNDAASVFTRPRRGGKTALERTFENRGSFHRGEGDTLLYSGPCHDVASKPGVACLRKPDGQWSELDRSAELGDAPQGEPLRVIAWVPREESAFLVVGGKGGGVWDAKSGAKSKLDDEQMSKVEPLFAAGTGKPFIDRFAVSPDGALVGVALNGVGFRLSDGGKKVERSPFRFSNVMSAGKRALARDASSNTLWQSSDWGWTYTEVDGPPDPVGTRDEPRHCSEVGCSFNQWIRTGWEPRTPAARPPSQSRQGSSDPAHAKRPQLKCSATGALARRATPSTDQRPGFGAETLVIDESSFVALYPRGMFHGSLGAIEALNLRAIVTGRHPTSSNAAAQRRRIRLIEPFDPAAVVNDSSIGLSELLDAARSSASLPPDPAATDERGQATVVLSDPPGVLLSGSQGPMLWTRGKDKPLPLGVPQDAPLTPMSAVRTAADELTLLATNSEGDAIVRALGRGRTNELFTIPRVPAGALQPLLPDALSLGPDGQLAVIRLTTDSPPTKEDPALLLRTGEAPAALAPWSTLDVDGSAACAGMVGQRAILVTREPWVISGISADQFRDQPSFMRVRWNATQVCLEAIEVLHGSHELPTGSSGDSYIVARFGKENSAGHVMLAEGAELREPRSCELIR